MRRQVQKGMCYKFGLSFLCGLSLILIVLIISDFDTDAKSQVEISISSDNEVDSTTSTATDSLLFQSNELIRIGKFVEALVLAEKSLHLNKQNNDFKAIGNSYNKIATIHYYQAEFSKALTYFDQGIASYKEVNYLNGIATLINNKGAIYYYLGNFPRALEHYKEAASLNAKLNNKMQSATTIQNIGGIYLELEDFDQAMKHFEMAQETYEELQDTLSLSQVNNSIGDLYLRKHLYDLALVKFQQAFSLALSINHQQSILEVYYNLGDIYQTLGDFEKAMDYYRQSRELANRMNNTLYQSLSLIGIGTTYSDANQPDKAIDYCQSGLEIAEENKTISIQRDACDCFYNAYKLLKQSNLALRYLEKSIVLKDSLHARQTADGVLNMQFEKQMLLDSIAHVEKQNRLELLHQEDLRKKERQRNILIIIGCFLIVIAVAFYGRLNYVRRSKKQLQKEKDRSEHLLLNILPEEIANELKEKGYVDAQNFECSAILFTDFVSFTETASRLTPKALVQELNICFKAFDIIIDEYHLEKIKTIGDAYMAAGGVPRPDDYAIKKTILAALEMQEFIIRRKLSNLRSNRPFFDMRVGIHAGPIVAGIVGVRKFQYDIWGDTVNTASRIESNGDLGRVNISRDAYLLVKDEMDLEFEYRGKIQAKGKGDIDMYFVTRKGQVASKSIEHVELAYT